MRNARLGEVKHNVQITTAQLGDTRELSELFLIFLHTISTPGYPECFNEASFGKRSWQDLAAFLMALGLGF